MLLVIPAIDLVGGHCVRLKGGTYEDQEEYFVDPVKMAKLWRVQNARTLHLVDVDRLEPANGERAPDNRDIIYEIARVLDIPIEVGGGIRTMEDIAEMLAAGVYRVVLSPAAIEDPAFVEEAVGRYSTSRVVASIEAREGEVMLSARRRATGRSAVEAGLELERRGVRRIVYSDIDRHGRLTPANFACYRQLADALTHCRITASGGVDGYRDLLRLQELAPMGLDSVIIGRALYENRFPCQRFWCWHRKDLVDLDRYSTARLAGTLGQTVRDKEMHD